MKKGIAILMGMFLVGSFMLVVSGKADGSAKKSAAELEKEKAMKDPYANDFGPEKIDDVVKGYPAQVRDGYKLVAAKCAKCHPSSRPLNSQFVETEGKSPAERGANLAKLKKEHPELFKDKYVWQIESGIWERYVKRMMAKPGCEISREEGKKIWQFLVYDSNQRKIKGAGAWKANRQKLLDDFKANNPKRYAELYK
ncbi:MAG: hypothetical protein HY399_05595 [Elusimicrobia bacterium]|nr:hypothetical protein [Elusimicrobiota bacterium]